MREATFKGVVALVVLFVALAAPASAAPVLPPGFELETLASGLTLPVGLAWAPDGRMFIAEKDGVLKVREPGGTVKTVLDMRDDVNSHADRGMLGVALDKGFADNGQIYIYYTVEVPLPWKDGDERTISRLDRITVDANSAVTSPHRETILGTYQPPVDEFYCPRPHTNDVDCIPADQYWHTVGTVRVDSGDGTLWLGSGDALPPAEGAASPIAFRTFDEATYAGKIIHVTRDGRGVPGHPFCPAETDTTKVCTKLYAKGFRQPYRFSLRDTTPSAVPRTPERGPVVGDVGWGLREEIDLVRPGRNYGWPCYEGLRTPSPYHEASACADLYAATGTAAATAPSLQYHQRDAGGSIIGGPILQGSAYPGVYAGRIYFADYSNQWIRSVPVDPASDFLSDADDYRPADFISNAGGVVDLELAPDGNLTYVDINTGSVRRIVHTTGNRAPILNATATPDNGIAPIDVEFSSDGTSDPDADPLSYRWEFGDGAPDSTEASPTHTYVLGGQFTAKLTVSDGDRSATKSFVITTDNTRPQASVTGPATYRGGIPVSLSATASDPEDGEIASDDHFTWQVVLVHHTHQHFIGTLGGREVEFTPRADHDLDSHYEVRMRVSDSGGLSDEVVHRLDPESVQLSLDSVPAGAPFDYGERSGTLPFTTPTAIGYSTTLSAAPSFVKDGVTYAFESWSDGSPRTHAFTVPATDTERVATYDGVPTAVLTVHPGEGTAPLDVSFDASGSNDPDGEALTYEWDFGDGSAHSTAAAPSHTYGAGSHTATLTVRDGRVGVASASARVHVLPAPPPLVFPSAGRGIRVAAPRSGIRVGPRGVLALRVVNDGPTEAFGNATITTAKPVALRATRVRRITLGKRAFTVAPSSRVGVRIRLSKRKRALLARKRRLAVVIAIRSGLRGEPGKDVAHTRTTLLAPRHDSN